MGLLVGAFIVWMFIGMIVSWESYCRHRRDNDDD